MTDEIGRLTFTIWYEKIVDEVVYYQGTIKKTKQKTVNYVLYEIIKYIYIWIVGFPNLVYSSSYLKNHIIL